VLRSPSSLGRAVTLFSFPRILDRSAVLVHPDSRISSGADRHQNWRGQTLSAALQRCRSAAGISQESQ